MILLETDAVTIILVALVVIHLAALECFMRFAEGLIALMLRSAAQLGRLNRRVTEIDRAAKL